MLTYFDLILVIVIALLFVIGFKVQKAISPESYYSVGNYLIEKSITIRQVLLRFILILLFSSFLNLFLKTKIITLGITLGAILIIWPAIINPSQTFPSLNKNKKIIYYLFLILFVISSALTSLLGFKVDFNMVINKLLENILFTIVLLVILGTQDRFARILSIGIVKQKNENDNE